MRLDDFDRKILRVLQEDCSLSTAEIAERVGLSQSPCWRRIAAMEEDGIIRKRVALIDRRKVGLGAQVFANVKLSAHGRAHMAEFEATVREIEEIEAYEKLFFEKLSRLPGVQEITSSMALSEIKSTTALPVRASQA